MSGIIVWRGWEVNGYLLTVGGLGAPISLSSRPVLYLIDHVSPLCSPAHPYLNVLGREDREQSN